MTTLAGFTFCRLGFRSHYPSTPSHPEYSLTIQGNAGVNKKVANAHIKGLGYFLKGFETWTRLTGLEFLVGGSMDLSPCRKNFLAYALFLSPYLTVVSKNIGDTGDGTAHAQGFPVADLRPTYNYIAYTYICVVECPPRGSPPPFSLLQRTHYDTILRPDVATSSSLGANKRFG